MQYNLIYQFSKEYERWGADKALVDIKTIQNCIRFLHTQPSTLPIPEFTLNPNRTISFEWVTECNDLHLEIGKTRFSLYTNAVNSDSLLIDGDATNIPEDLITSIYDLASIMDNEI